MPAEAGIQVREVSGFRVALAIASLPGMTIDFYGGFLEWDTRSLVN
jgi:hypothetical protein